MPLFGGACWQQVQASQEVLSKTHGDALQPSQVPARDTQKRRLSSKSAMLAVHVFELAWFELCLNIYNFYCTQHKLSNGTTLQFANAHATWLKVNEKHTSVSAPL